MDYNKTAVLSFGTVSGASAGWNFYFSIPSGFMIKKMWAVVNVAGAAAAHSIKITNTANSETYAEMTIGTAIAGTVISLSIDETERERTASEALRVYTATNSASSSYDFFVLIAHQE